MDGDFDIVGAREEPVADLDQALGILAAAASKRRTAAHRLNEHSSRSCATIVVKANSSSRPLYVFLPAAADWVVT